MKKRLPAALMALAMSAGMLTACGGSETSSAAASDTTAESASSSEAASEEMPTVVMYYPLSGIPADQDMVAEKINEYVKEILNIDLQLNPLPISSYDDQMNMIMAGSEQVDLALIWGEDVSNFAAKGALVELDDLLDEYGQGIKDCLGDYLEAGAVSGVQYQVPVNRSLFYQSGVVLRKDILEKYNIDYEAIEDENDLEAAFEIIKAGEPDMSMIQAETAGARFYWNDFDGLSDNFGVLMDYGQNLDVVNLYATDEFKEMCAQRRDWYKKGYIASDALTATESAADLVKAGKLLGYAVTVGPGTEQDKTNQCGTDMVMVALRKPYSYTSKVNGFGWGILQNSANPEAAMQVLNLMYTDSTFLNMLDWGIEGVHYQMKDGSDRIITFADGIDSSTSGYFHNWSFAFGDQLSAYFWDGTEEDFPEQVRAMNESAIQSKAMGFACDLTNVKTEYTAVSNVVDKYEAALTLGCIDPDENLPKFLDELEAAGLSKIIAEKQTQLDAWAEASGKAS